MADPWGVRATARRATSALLNGAWDRLRTVAATGPGDARARRFGAFGEGACIAFPPGNSFGERWIHIGANTMIGPHVSLSAGMVPGQAMITDPVVRIGERCTIGWGSHIVGHLAIDIGDDVMFGPYVYVTDQNHGYEDPEAPIGTQWPEDRPVRIGSGSWIGTGATILPGADIGRNVVVAAGAVVTGDVPDRCIVAGVPARILRRWQPGLGWTSVAPADPSADAAPEEHGRTVTG